MAKKAGTTKAGTTKARARKARTKAARTKAARAAVEVMSDRKAAGFMAGFFDGTAEFSGAWLGDGEELVSTAEAAERLGVGVGVVDEMICDGRLESEKLGKIVMVFASDLHDELVHDQGDRQA
ncbi:MAG: hypothetical protein M3Q49_03760 [Actinomycetota bacterium]|nr:hypothetical protein [Actinomycetota bacterium]